MWLSWGNGMFKSPQEAACLEEQGGSCSQRKMSERLLNSGRVQGGNRGQIIQPLPSLTLSEPLLL